MDYVNLGRSGLKVSRICLGGNNFGAGYIDEEQALSIINEAYEQGISFIDTADVYNSGLSEQIIGRAVKNRRNDFVIATKGFLPTGPNVNQKGLSRKHIIEAVEGSLRRLATDHIDLYYVHFWDAETPLLETLRTLDDLIHQGKIRYIGCSNFAAWQLCRALWISDKHDLERFEVVQREYNFLRRRIESDLFPLCTDQQVGVTAFQVLMGGLLSGTYARSSEPPDNTHMATRHAERAKKEYWNEANFKMVDRLKAMAAEVGCEPTQLILAWVLSKPTITSVVIGAGQTEHVVKNAKARDIILSPEILEQLDALGI